MNHFKTSLIVFLLVGFAVSLTEAQPAPSPADSSHMANQHVKSIQIIAPGERHLNEFSIWFGYSYDSMRFWGKTRNTTLESFGAQYNRKFLKFYGHDVKYTFRLIYSKYNYPEYKVGHPRNTLTGFGVSPLGFQINFKNSSPVEPFLNSSGGIMILDGPFPDSRGKKFNFTFSAGAGLEFLLSNSASLSVGIKFHHLSNFQRGQINPGVDSGLFYSSITIF
ncbi:MAG TPA: acyloxyacyl hydrolase [Balneolaceae bacterium]|nr:acyloxyacyl hydrolase [Balneolaceae bacterium]